MVKSKLPFNSKRKSMGLGENLLRQSKMRLKTKNYIWDSIDTTNIKGDKPLEIKIPKKKKTKNIKKRKYNRKPKKYYVYIKSKFWKERKNKYYQTYGKKCHICRSSRYIELHHLEYRSDLFGKELDEMLVPLCLEHHKEFHTLYGTKQKMYNEFNEYSEIKYEEFRHLL